MGFPAFKRGEDDVESAPILSSLMLLCPAMFPVCLKTMGGGSACHGEGSRVGGRRGDDSSFLFRPPLSEPCMQLSLHTALQYRSLGLSSGFDFRKAD